MVQGNWSRTARESEPSQRTVMPRDPFRNYTSRSGSGAYADAAAASSFKRDEEAADSIQRGFQSARGSEVVAAAVAISDAIAGVDRQQPLVRRASRAARVFLSTGSRRRPPVGGDAAAVLVDANRRAKKNAQVAARVHARARSGRAGEDGRRGSRGPHVLGGAALVPRRARSRVPLRLGRQKPERVPVFCRADFPLMNRGYAAAAAWIFRGDESWRRRGRDVDIPRR